MDARLAAHAGTALGGEIPPRIAALLATEDSHVADHVGIDWRGALRAPLGRVSGSDRGGSTVHQQLARVVYEDGATDPPAKARAVVLALKLVHPELAQARQAHVLERLVDVGTLERDDAGRVAATSWGLVQG